MKGGRSGMDAFDRLETPRLVLRKAADGDLNKIWENVWRDAVLAETMLWTPTPTLAQARERLARTVAYQKGHYGYFVCRKDTDEPIGFAGVRETEPGTFEETGVCIARAWQGQGLGKEALSALVELVFDALGGRRFLYSCMRGNAVSAALCKGCGFRYLRSEGKTRERDGLAYICDVYERTL